MSKRTPFKKLIKKKGTKVINEPEKFLSKKKSDYSPEYLRQLPYRIQNRYGTNQEPGLSGALD